jgi:hypothetical protein
MIYSTGGVGGSDGYREILAVSEETIWDFLG